MYQIQYSSEAFFYFHIVEIITCNQYIVMKSKKNNYKHSFLWKTRTKNTHLQFIVDIGNDSYYPSFMENSIYSGNFHINIQGLILSFGKLAFYVWIGTSCLAHATFSLTASIHKMNILLFNTLNIDFIGLFELWFLGVQAIDLF